MGQLGEGSYRDNLELIQWFKGLSDAQYPGPVGVLTEAGSAMAYIYPTSKAYEYGTTLPDC